MVEICTESTTSYGSTIRFSHLVQISRFIVEQYETKANKFIGKSGTFWKLLRETNSYDDPNLTSLSISSDTNAQCDNHALVIEVLTLGERCMQHCQDVYIPVTVMEQWVLRFVSFELKNIDIVSNSVNKLEVLNYLESSPVMSLLNAGGSAFASRLAYRHYFSDEFVSRLGETFLMNLKDLSNDIGISECISFLGRFTNEQCHMSSEHLFQSMTGSSLSEENEHNKSNIKHVFTPIKFNDEDCLQIYVVAVTNILNVSPICPLCNDVTCNLLEPIRGSFILPNSLLFSEAALNLKHSSNYAVIRSRHNGIYNRSKQCFNVSPTRPIPVTEKILSPIVVMNTVEEQILHPLCTHPFRYVLSIGRTWNLDKSDTYTLTKKTRHMSSSLRDQPSIGSPPRKQQRVGGHSHEAQKCVQECSQLSTKTVHRDGAINKVIAEFTLLNVERRFRNCNGYFVETVCTDNTRNASTPANNKCESTCSDSVQNDVKKRSRATQSETYCGQIEHTKPPFFNRHTGLPLRSSPVPLKRSSSGKFDFDFSFCQLRSFNSVTDYPVPCSPNLHQSVPKVPVAPNVQGRRRPSSLRFSSNLHHTETSFASPNLDARIGNRTRNPKRRTLETDGSVLSCSAPPSGDRIVRLSADRMKNTLVGTPVAHTSNQHLLVNFEESMLNGRIHPIGQVNGFSLELGASGSFYPKHVRLMMQAFFFDLSDDNAPSPYLGYADLRQLPNPKGYHVPKKGSIQLTLFNPTGLVVKMFVIVYDLEDMPPNCQTFLRQRTMYMPTLENSTESATSFTSPFLSLTHQLSHFAKSTVSVNNNSNCNKKNSTNESPLGVLSNSVSATSSWCSSSSSICSSCSSISPPCSSTDLIESRQFRNFTTIHQTKQPRRTGPSPWQKLPAYLRYLVHLRFHTTKSGRLYLHTDLRLIFSRDKFEFDPRIVTYELRSFMDAPSNPRYSPKKWLNRSSNF